LTNKEVLWYYLPPIIWALAIFVGSSIPSKDFPDLKIFSYDKLLHFGVFFVLAILTYRAFAHQRRYPLLAGRALLLTFFATFAYGATDELHQFLVPGRTPDIFDLAADSTGVALALLFLLIWRKRRERAVSAR
jgi:VanZ family protein